MDKESNVSHPCSEHYPHGDDISVPNGDSMMVWLKKTAVV